MHSSIKSVLTAVLLLLPISAVPLMAIFGIPQFTPAIASPLEELTDGKPTESARRKPRKTPKNQRAEDFDVDLTEEESPDWNEAALERSRSFRKSKNSLSMNRSLPESAEENLTAQNTDAEPSAAPAVEKNRPTAASDETEDDFPIRRAVHESSPDRAPAVRPADGVSGIQDLLSTEMSPAIPQGVEIPGYRRQRPSPNDNANRGIEKNGSRKKRQLPVVEPLTWPQAVQRLNELGIRNFRLEPGERTGEFHFVCSYTPSQTPHVSRRFEAEADDPLKAVSKVLAQVEEATQQRVLAAPRRSTESPDRFSRD